MPSLIVCVVLAGVACSVFVFASLNFMRKDGGSWRDRFSAASWLETAIAAFAIALFLAVSALLSLTDSHWINVVGLGVLLLLAYVLVMVIACDEVSPRHYPCPECTRLMDSNISWKCGACGSENRNRSFGRKCETCRQFPETVACTHCDRPFSTVGEEPNENQISRVIQEPRKGETIEQAVARLAAERAAEVADREHRIRLLGLDAEIKAKERRIAALSDSPRTPATAQQEWLLKELEALEFSVKSVQKAKEEEARLIKVIETSGLPSTDQEECKQLLRARVGDLNERLRIDSIQM